MIVSRYGDLPSDVVNLCYVTFSADLRLDVDII